MTANQIIIADAIDRMQINRTPRDELIDVVTGALYDEPMSQEDYDFALGYWATFQL